jgi:hypothetical protein
VEIWIGTNVSWHTYQYYDYTSETSIDWIDRSTLFGKPLCIDMENHYIIWVGFSTITVTDIRTQRHIIEYILNEDDTDPYKVQIENDKLIVLFKDKQIIFDYPY